MRVLHLFDWYLPSTLSWVSRLLWYLPDTEVWVGAPWIVRNQFSYDTFRYLDFPIQRRWFSTDTEGAFPFAQYLLTRSQRFLPSYRTWLKQRLARDRPDVLHAHYGPTGCLYLPLAKQFDLPLVVTFYGFDYQKILQNRPVFRKKYRALFEHAARVVVASPTGSKALEALGCPGEKLRIVRPCPDFAQFPFVNRNKTAKRLRLVQVATFTEKKGHRTTLEAFRLALPQCPNLRLTLAGEPYDRQLVKDLEAYIRTHRLSSHIEWLGPVRHDQMAAFLSKYDVFVHPSQTSAAGDHEATPVVLLEAQATGLPVLATRHFDLPDIVQHGQAGWLVDEQDATALSDVVRLFYSMDEMEYENYSRQAHRWSTTRFSVASSADDLRKIYAELT